MSRRLVVPFVAALAIGMPGVLVAAPTASAAAVSSSATGSVTTVAAAKPGPNKPATKPAPVKPGPAKPTPAPTRTTLRQGSRGQAVLALQKRLGALGYWVGKPSGTFDHTTAQAVMAVQKVAGLGPDGVAGPATWKALDRGVRPKARSTKGRVVEIDLRRQVLMLVVGGRVQYVVNTSTGTAATPTPRGPFRIYRGYASGWRTAPLGKLYRPKYFHRGYAVHGVRDGFIPARPASHGCARVSTKAMDMMWTSAGLRNGDKVWVY